MSMSSIFDEHDAALDWVCETHRELKSLNPEHTLLTLIKAGDEPGVSDKFCDLYCSDPEEAKANFSSWDDPAYSARQKAIEMGEAYLKYRDDLQKAIDVEKRVSEITSSN